VGESKLLLFAAALSIIIVCNQSVGDDKWQNVPINLTTANVKKHMASKPEWPPKAASWF
jgi:hypothetical protein